MQVWEATVRQVTEQAGTAQVRLQAEQVATIQAECPESPTGPPLQLMSVDGAYIQMVAGEGKEVKTLALGVVSQPVEERGKQLIHTTELSAFSRMSEANTLQHEALVEVHQRGVERAGVCSHRWGGLDPTVCRLPSCRCRAHFGCCARDGVCGPSGQGSP